MSTKELFLAEIQKVESVNTLAFAEKNKIPHQDVVGALKSLELVQEGNLESTVQEQQSLQITDFGKELLAAGESPEFALYKRVASSDVGVHRKELQEAGLFGGFNHGKNFGWLNMGKDQVVTANGTPSEDKTIEILKKVQADATMKLDDDSNKVVVRRKAVKQVTVKYFIVKKGPNFQASSKKQATELTEDMIRTGEWKNTTFKKYNFAGGATGGGYLHPLLKVRAEYRAKFFEMGFTEMPTNNFVESSFWNFDSLFQPQQHAARDAHDTFFLLDPANALSLPKEYMEIVKDTHETGGSTGSVGYNTPWSEAEARKNILRTHTTAVSARMLKKLGEQKPFKPAKLFSIDRVYRNETMDSTHLAEFHQIEGVVADYNLTLGDLIGILNEFFNKLGITNLRFKPAFNPYTEPSMEIFSYHEGLGKWVEIGNSGMFRPEMLEPMGLPKDVSVIAWGLSLERPTMIMYEFDNIRDLVGHRVKLSLTRDLPICNI